MLPCEIRVRLCFRSFSAHSRLLLVGLGGLFGASPLLVSSPPPLHHTPAGKHHCVFRRYTLHCLWTYYFPLLSFIVSLQSCSSHVRKLKIPFLKPILAQQTNFPFSGVLTCFVFFKISRRKLGFTFFIELCRCAFTGKKNTQLLV